MRLPDLKPKTKVFKLGGAELEFRQVILEDYNSFVDVFKVTESDAADPKVLSKVQELLATLLVAEDDNQAPATHEQKLAFFRSVPIGLAEKLTELIYAVMDFSGLTEDQIATTAKTSKKK
jgi:hypothetical protein